MAMLGACLCMFCGQPPVAMYTFGVFVPEIADVTSWPAASIAAAIGPGALVAALLSPLVGAACDRFGTRKMALVGGPAFGFGLVMVGLAPQSPAAFLFYTVVMWTLSFAGSPVPYAQMVTALISERRGLALSLMFACGALGIAVWPPYAAYLIGTVGWRLAYVWLGLSAGTGIFVAALFLLRDVPTRSQASTAIGMTVREALKTARFWKIAVVFLLLTGVLAGAAVNLPVILRRQGFDPQTASFILSVTGISMLVGRLALGPLLDKFFAPYVAIGIIMVPVLGISLLIADDGRATIIVAASLIGIGLGSEFNAAAYIVGRAFGQKSFGAIYGLITLFYGLGGASGPAALGVALVRTVSASVVFTLCLMLLFVAALLLATMKRTDLSY